MNYRAITIEALSGLRADCEAQRDFLLGHEWVQEEPRLSGQACLVVRQEPFEEMNEWGETHQLCTIGDALDQVIGRFREMQSDDARDRGWWLLHIPSRIFAIAIGRVCPVPPDRPLDLAEPEEWNDNYCPSSGVAIEVLDEAIAICKQALAELEAEAEVEVGA